MSREVIRNLTRCVLIHHHPEYAEIAADIMAQQWNHKDGEIKRNLKSMLQESKDTLPCHLAFVLRFSAEDVEILKTEDDKFLYRKLMASSHIPGAETVVGHVKLTKADGRSDGACCICYSLVVDKQFRGLGLGRLLTEEAENFARSLKLSYMYLSTNDKVEFYEHLGYQQCEPVSSLGNNSKRLTASQVSSLEGLFAKRLNIANPTDCNTWLRKRLIVEYSLQPPLGMPEMKELLVEKLSDVLYAEKSLTPNIEEYKSPIFLGLLLPMPWQQQTGPSCGISAINMVNALLQYDKKSIRQTTRDLSICKRCTNYNQEEKPNVRMSIPNKSKEKPQNTESEDGQIAETGSSDNKNSPLSLAVKSGVSNDGELFCAYNLIYVASKSLQLNLDVENLSMDFKKICDYLTKGFPILIPYDRDLGNHAPGFSNGNQAHWTVIIGFLVSCECSVLNKFNDSPKLPETQESLRLVNILENRETARLIYSNCIENKTHDDDIILICSHGMSSKPFLCRFTEMYKSNAQLHSSKSKFYKTSDDLAHLRGKVVFVKV